MKVSSFYFRLLGGVALSTLTTAAIAQTPATGPDDMCLPTDDPCIIDQAYEVQSPGSLNFGARTVRIVPGGKLLRSVAINASNVRIETGTTAVAIDSSEPGGVAGTITIFATGGVTVGGKLSARGNPGGEIDIEGESVVINARILADGSPVGSSGGSIRLTGGQAPMIVTAALVTKSVRGNDYYESPNGGITIIRSFGDVEIHGPIESGGGDSGGTVDINTEGVVTLANDIVISSGVGLSYGSGGNLYIYSDTGIDIYNSRLAANGTTGYYIDPYGGSYSYPGYGGNHRLKAYSGDIEIASTVKFYANGGPGGGPQGGYYSQAGWLLLQADEGKVTMDGDFTAKGYGGFGKGGELWIHAASGIEMAQTSDTDLRSRSGGIVDFRSPGGYLRLDGTIDVRGRNRTPNSQYDYYGYGGQLEILGRDVVMNGKMLQGADGYGGTIEMEMCRFHLFQNGRIDATNGAPDGGGSVYLSVRESLITDQGSVIQADGVGGGRVDLDYRSGKPPVLNGLVTPSPLLHGWLNSGCPVCGNLEVDAGESCDDGNLVSGDDCNDQCQDEGCVAATLDYPTNPLCFDGDACTVDTCDPVSHTCSSVVSCEEGVACTVDVCALGACEHTPDDSRCDDFDDCTDDLCNATTGCVYAGLTGAPCEDGNLCTLSGECERGTCVVAQLPAVPSTRNQIKFRLRVEANSDKMSYKGLLSLDHFTTNAAVTGMTVELRDANDQVFLSGQIPNTWFEDRDGTGVKVRFRDKDHALVTGAGIEKIQIIKKSSKNTAKVKIKAAETDLSGADGQATISLSILFGTDPSVHDCLAALYVPCEPRPGKNKCKDPS